MGRARRFVVVSTQGKGDEAALGAALAIEAEYRAFVGSRRKMAALREPWIVETEEIDYIQKKAAEAKAAMAQPAEPSPAPAPQP